jgi:hypothetical protein
MKKILGSVGALALCAASLGFAGHASATQYSPWIGTSNSAWLTEGNVSALVWTGLRNSRFLTSTKAVHDVHHTQLTTGCTSHPTYYWQLNRHVDPLVANSQELRLEYWCPNGGTLTAVQGRLIDY